MSERDWEAAKLALQYAAENRRAEIALLWSRALYFWGFIAVVLVAYGGAYQSNHKNLALIAACFGFICSLCWSLVNRSGKYWQLVWETKTEEFAAAVVGDRVFPRASNPDIGERWFWGARQYSPSRLAMAVSDWAVLAWIALAFGAFRQKRVPFDLCAIVVTSAYAAAILIWCQSETAQRAFWARVQKRLPSCWKVWLAGRVEPPKT